MGCILIGVLLVPAAVKRFGKKQVCLGGLDIVGRWRYPEILSVERQFLFVIFSCVAFFGTAFVSSLNCGTGYRIRLTTWVMENGYSR